MRSALITAAGAVGELGELALSPLARISPALRQSAVLRETGHRPWPLPERPWVMAQTWGNLLFAHWPVPEVLLRRVVPSSIPLDTYEGQAWLGVTPFQVSVFRPRGLPHVPRVTRFDEVNVRTYTTIAGKPGIWFLSLDATSALAVHAARWGYRLPYFRTQMSVQTSGDAVEYRARRTARDGPAASLRATCLPTGPPFTAAPGSLEYFLTERYCLFVLDDRRRVHRADIHHPPWALMPASGNVQDNSMASPLGIELDDPPLMHVAQRQDVVFWAPLGD